VYISYRPTPPTKKVTIQTLTEPAVE